MPTRSPVALACALALGCGLGAGTTVFAVGCDRARAPAIAAAPSDEKVGARAKEILKGSDPLQRVADLTALFQTLGPSAVPAVREAIEDSPFDGWEPEFALFGMWWARFDPQAAFEWTHLEPRAQRGTVISTIVRTWAHRDPEAALAAARGIIFPVQRDIGVDAAIAGWDESGKPGLLEEVAKLRDSDQQRVADTLARRRVLALGAEGAFRWVESLDTTPPFKEMMTVRVASAAAGAVGGGAFAAAWAAPRVRSDDRLSNYPRRIATRWVVREPEAAMAWLASLPAGADRSDGVTEAFRAWTIHDHEAAFAWIDKIEIQPWNEPAVAVYTRWIAKDRPKEAIELARRIGDADLREATMIVIGQVWTQNDRAAAEAWLAQPGVPERVRRASASAVAPPGGPVQDAQQKAPADAG